jgi:DNA-binding HxlR family transcriptional regulator
MRQNRYDDLLGGSYSPDCPGREILDHVMSRWGVLVLLVLRDRTHRFSELRRGIGGVSEKMLAQTLRTLEEDGFVLRRDFGEVPPRVEYELTPMGRRLARHVAALATWIADNTADVLAAREKRRRAGSRPGSTLPPAS